MMKFLTSIALPAYVLDQLSKWWIVTHYALMPSPDNLEQFPEVITRTAFLPEAVDVIPGWFQIVYWANTGAAFSMGHGRNAFFIGLSLVGVALFGAVLLLYRETNLAPNPNALEFSSLRRAFKRVLSHPQSRQFLGVCVLLQIAVVLLVVNAPRLFKSAFDIEGLSFALLFAVGAVGIILGQLTSNRIIARIGVLATLRGAIAVLGITSFAMWVSAQTGYTSAAVFTSLLFVFNMTFLVVFTNSVSLVLDPHRDIAGVASALLGCITQLVGNVCALLLMPWIDGVMTTWSLVQLVLVAAAVVTVWSYRPRLDVSRSTSNG